MLKAHFKTPTVSTFSSSVQYTVFIVEVKVVRIVALEMAVPTGLLLQIFLSHIPICTHWSCIIIDFVVNFIVCCSLLMYCLYVH